jgi:hypothetical protein
MNQQKLSFDNQYFGHLPSYELKNKLIHLRNMSNNLFKEKLRLRHIKDNDTEKKYRAKIQTQLYMYLMYKAKNSSDPNVRTWGFKLQQLVKNEI